VASLVRKWLRERMLVLGVLTESECAEFLKLLAEAPEKLWGEPTTTGRSRLFSEVEGGKMYTFLYAPLAFTGVGRQGGTLNLPNGRMVLFLFDWGAGSLNGHVREVRVSVNAQQAKNARQQYLTFIWDRAKGFSARSSNAVLGFRRAMAGRYGWCVFAANASELRLMYFTQLFPSSVIQRFRALSND
jgi:hypothetical protein